MKIEIVSEIPYFGYGQMLYLGKERIGYYKDHTYHFIEIGKSIMYIENKIAALEKGHEVPVKTVNYKVVTEDNKKWEFDRFGKGCLVLNDHYGKTSERKFHETKLVVEVNHEKINEYKDILKQLNQFNN